MHFWEARGDLLSRFSRLMTLFLKQRHQNSTSPDTPSLAHCLKETSVTSCKLRFDSKGANAEIQCV